MSLGRSELGKANVRLRKILQVSKTLGQHLSYAPIRRKLRLGSFLAPSIRPTEPQGMLQIQKAYELLQIDFVAVIVPAKVSVQACKRFRP